MLCEFNSLTYLVLKTGKADRFLDDKWVEYKTEEATEDWYLSFDSDDKWDHDDPQYEKLLNRGAIYVAGEYPITTPDLREMISTKSIYGGTFARQSLIFSLDDVQKRANANFGITRTSVVMSLIDIIMTRTNQKYGCKYWQYGDMFIRQLPSGHQALFVDIVCDDQQEE